MTSNTTTNTFTFYDAWISRQEALLQRLDSLILPENGFDVTQECKHIIPEVFSLHRDYQTQRARAAAGDPCVQLFPPWLTPFEKTMLWAAGFRPSMLFPILDRAVAEELSGEQRERLGALRTRTRATEERITHDMAVAQEKVAEEPACRAVRAAAGGVPPGMEVDLELQGVKAALAAVVESADELRRRTAAEVMEVLSPEQSVRLLAAAERFQIQARKFGEQKEADREMAVPEAMN